MRAVWVLAASGWLLAGCGDRVAVAPALGVAASSAASSAAPSTASSVASAAAYSATVGTGAQTAPAGAAAPAAPAVAAAPAAVPASADRLPPPSVPPVERNGVRYSQAEDGRTVGVAQVGGVLVASDTRSGQRLWTLAVYGNPVDAKLEADVQWLFFKSMAFDPDGRLRIVSEAGHTYLVDVNTRRVSPVR